MELDADVIVIGGGHAGCEAALASARVGCETVLVTGSLARIATLPCNCSIGGPAKAHAEVSYLGNVTHIGLYFDAPLSDIF